MTFLSIGTKLVILVLGVSLISVAISTGLAFNLTDSIIKTNVEDTLQEESRARGEAVSSIIQTRINNLKVLASNDIIKETLLQLPSGIDDVTFQHLLGENQEYITNEVASFQQNEFDASLRDLKIVNNRGKLIYSLSEDDSVDFNPRETKVNSPKVKFIQSENKERLLRFVIPITANGGSVIGSIIATTDSSALDGILLNRFGLQETGEVYLVNKDMLMVSESLFVEDAEFTQRVETEPVRECFENGQSVSGLVYSDYRGVDIFGVSYCQKERDYVLITEVDESAILEPIYSLQEKIIMIGGSLMVIATAVTYFLSKRLSNPILKLRDAANRISEGDFEVKAKVKTNDEIGQLSSAFDSMTKTINETVSAISRRNDIIKRQEDILQQFSQTKEDSCVCLVDIVGSLKITKDLSEVKKKRYYKVFTDAILDKIKEHKGISVKFINDAVLFYFPSSKYDDVFTTSLNCCLDIASLNQSLNDKMEGEDLPGIGYRISLTYGKIDTVSGETASVEDIFGEPVSLAFKINQYALPNLVIIEKSLYEKIKDKDFEFTELDKSLVKELEYDVYLVSKK